MSSVLVCDRWPLFLQEGEGGYYHYINKKAGEVGRNAYCIRWLLNRLNEDFQTVVEPFGGVGVFATVIQGTCQPAKHYLFDIDDDCLTQLRSAFFDTPSVVVKNARAEDTIGAINADLYVLDFPSPFTIMRHDKWRKELDRLFASKPRAVIWMDSASFGMQWHKDRYSEFSGEKVAGNEGYLRAISHETFARYGYSVRAATVTKGCFYTALIPGPRECFDLCKMTTKGRAIRPLDSKQAKVDLPLVKQVTL